MPEDITPSDSPVTEVPEAPSIPPVEVPPTNPVQSPTAQPIMPPITTAEPFAMPSAAPVEPEMPESKPKNKLLPIIGGIAALLLVVGVAGASYFVSNQLSTRQAVAPNAPESKPAAQCYTNCPEGTKGDGSGKDANGCYTCVPINGGGGGGGGTSSCDSTNITHPACRGKSVGDEVCYNGVNLVCFRGTGNNGAACGADPGGNACSSGGGGGGDTSCTKNGDYHGCAYVNNIGDTNVLGAPCDADNWANQSCTAYSYNCGNYCLLASCGGSACTSNPTGTPTTPPTVSPSVPPEVGACMDIKIYKKVGGVYQTTPLTTTELQSLKVGDVLKFGITSSSNNLKGRFKVTVVGTADEWLGGTIDTTNKKLITYSDYTISTAGTYKFEGQVSLTP